MPILACLSALVAAFPVSQGASEKLSEKMTSVFTFDKESGSSAWPATNDGVMGGLSEGRSTITRDGLLRFSGKVSLENNGGFASIRSAPAEKDLSAYDGILLRVRGDGKRYAFTIRTDLRIPAGSYRVKFDTQAGEWVEVFMPFADLRATSFGVELSDAPPLDPRKIRSFGFLISDKQAGPFTLDVDWIKAASRPEPQK